MQRRALELVDGSAFVACGLVAAIFIAGALPSRSAAAQSGAAVAPTATATIPAVPPPGDAAHGKVLYQGCAACHSIDDNDIGPKHRGVVGRHAGIIDDYAYSAALKKSGLTWDEATLDRWLSNPSALVPGTKMFFKLDDAKSRADIIAYLKELK